MPYEAADRPIVITDGTIHGEVADGAGSDDFLDESVAEHALLRLQRDLMSLAV